MVNTQTLPPEIRRLINGKSTDVIFSQKSDLTIWQKFGSAYLILTDQELLGTSESSIVAQIPLSSIKEIKMQELVGGGRITADTENGMKHLLYYSNHLVPQFADAVRIINEYIRTGNLIELEPQRGTYCPKCNSPLPGRDRNCPRCVPRLKILKRIIELSAPYKLQVAILMLVSSFTVALQVLPPYITKRIVDDVIGQGNEKMLLPYVGFMVLIGILYLVMRLLNIQFTSWIGARIVTDLRTKLHTVLQHVKMNFFNRREPGEMVGRIMYDTDELQQFLVDGLPFLVIHLFSFFVIGAILFNISWSLTLFVLIPMPLLLIGSSWFWKKLNPLFLREGTIVGHIHSVLSESLQGLKVIKACSKEKHRIKAFDSVNEKLARTRIETQRISGSFNEILYFVMSGGIALVWFYSAGKITGTNPSMTLGDLIAFEGYIWLFYGPLQWFSVVFNWMTHAFSGAERIFEVIDTAPEAHDSVDTVTLPSIKGAIEFHDVRFSYERGKEVIKGLNFSIAPGETIGLVGRSGAGKSTIINLLSRFYEPDSGQINVDGLPIEKIELSQLRANMGIVMQEPFLFNATIAENIAYGMNHVSFKDVVEAARAAHAHEFIIRKPDGYDTLVGESGERLSGGEKQRVSIARAILHNPPILILDEATSSVDATTEKQIQEAIARLIEGRTTIAIAHRLSTLRNADRLIVINEGKIAEIGNHDELVRNNGIYADLVQSHTKINELQSVMWGG